MKSFKQYFFSEARKFPHLNPKVSVNQAIDDHLTSASMITGTRLENSFTSFTTVDKLGINPLSQYDTPLGIYAYHNKYVVKVIGKNKPASTLPFAGGSPYVNIFSVKGNIVHLNKMTSNEANDYYKKMIEYYLDVLKIKRGGIEWKTEVDIIERFINDAPTLAQFPRLAGGQFWYVSMKIKDLLAKRTNRKPRIVWNMLFRGIGIDGFVDTGAGIIHTSEPSQAVFFSIDVIAKNKRVDNKYSPDKVSRAKKMGKLQLTREKELLDQVRSLKTQEEQILAIEDDPSLIRFIKNPSEKVQLAAVETEPSVIRYIKNPSEKVQIAAVESGPSAIRDIKNPSEKVQIAAVENNSSAIGFIKNPSEKVQMATVENDLSAIRDIKNPSEKVQILVIENDPHSIKFIQNPTEKVQILAVKSDSYAIRYIKNPTEKVQILAIEDDPSQITNIENPTEKVKQLVDKT